MHISFSSILVHGIYENANKVIKINVYLIIKHTEYFKFYVLDYVIIYYAVTKQQLSSRS